MTFAEMDQQNAQRNIDPATVTYTRMSDLIAEHRALAISLESIRGVLAEMRLPPHQRQTAPGSASRLNPLGQSHTPMFHLGGWSCRLTDASAIELLERAEIEETKTLAALTKRLDAALQAMG